MWCSSQTRTIFPVIFVSAGLSGCSEVVNPNCPDGGEEFWGYAVVLRITDSDGRPAALGTTVRLIGSGVDEAVTGRSPEDTIIAIGRDPGMYRVEITRPWWVSQVIDRVRVRAPPNRCGGLRPVELDIVLALEPGAPAVRQVVAESDHIQVSSNPPYTVSGGDGRRQLTASVEADPGVSTEIDWMSVHPEIASVTSDGVLTVRCRESPIDALIVASSRADPGVFTTIRVTVLRTELWECPKS